MFGAVEFLADFVKSLINDDPAVAVKTAVGFMIGLGVGLVIPFIVVRHYRRSSSNGYDGKYVESLEQQIKHHEQVEESLTANLEEERTRYQLLHKRASRKVSHIKRVLEKRDKELATKTTELESMTNERDRLLQQIADVADSDGKVWESMLPSGEVPFVAAVDRRCRIVSLVNLKGGVGKTTLTLNLGYSLAERGDRVLLVDLDHQASLTNLCFKPKMFEQLRSNGRLIRTAFSQCSHPVVPKDIVEQVEDTNIWVAGADEELSSVETSVMAAWLMKKLDIDARLILRRAFHSAEFSDFFDWILIDCPPRLTTSSVNALACSDYFLVPGRPDDVSLDAVPRMLRWVSKLQGDSVQLCPQLSLLGIIATMTSNKIKLTSGEATAWKSLANRCDSRIWKGKPYQFHAFIPAKVAFADSARSGDYPRVAVRNKEVKEVFDSIVDEVLEQVPNNGRVKLEGIPTES